MPDADADLLTRWAAGDTRAGSALVERYFAPVYRFFQNKVGLEAEDLTQQTFEACVAQVDGIRDVSAFRSFALGVARNRLLMHFRARRSGAAAITDPEDEAVEHLAPETSPATMAVRRSELRLVLRAVRKVPLKHQVIIELRFWEDLTVPEIAEVLGIASGTVKSRLSRALDNLRSVLAEIDADPALRQSTVQGVDTWISDVRAARALEP